MTTPENPFEKLTDEQLEARIEAAKNALAMREMEAFERGEATPDQLHADAVMSYRGWLATRADRLRQVLQDDIDTSPDLTIDQRAEQQAELDVGSADIVRGIGHLPVEELHKIFPDVEPPTY